MQDDASNRVFTAGEVGEVAGLSYRQLNDWESKGALPPDPDRDAAWRRFSPREVFVLVVCAELRRSFGVPVDRLRFVRQFMLKDGADHLRAAVDLMSMLGVGVWLMTDFETTFVMDSELEFTDLWMHGYFGGPHNAYALLKVNPLVNRVLGSLKDPVQLPEHGHGYELMRELRSSFGVRTPEEFQALQLIRSGDFESVEVVLKDGTISRIRTTARPDEKSQIADLLQQHDYQTLTVTKRNGQIVSIQQEAVIKP
jgi:hypothetical protein